MVPMPPLSLRSNAGSFKPSQMSTLSCRRNSSKSVVKKVSHLLQISHTYYAVESGVAAMHAGKAIHALHKGCQPQKNKPQKSASHCPNCAHSHHPGYDNCPAWNAICKCCSEKVTGMQSATVLALLANNPLSPMELRRPTIINTVER